MHRLAFFAVVKIYKSGGYRQYLLPSREWSARYNLAVHHSDHQPLESPETRCPLSPKVLRLLPEP
jgi:hypothetical protein